MYSSCDITTNYSLIVYLCLSLSRSGVMCLRGYRSVKNHPVSANINLAYCKGRLDAGALE